MGHVRPVFAIPLQTKHFYRAASLCSITINHALSISTDSELIQALGCDIHYSGALVLGAVLVELRTVPALPNLECRINMIIATLFVI